MTITTLTKTDVCQLDGTGAGQIILKPDVGQNWAPLFVRVSTNNQSTPIAFCSVFHGSPGVSAQPSQFIDDTFLGSGDTSSMISGTPILFGEGIIFKFTGGTAGDTAIATVYGLTSDVPPNLNLLPQVPGTHFAGHIVAEITQTLAFVSNLSPTAVPAGGQILLGPFDVRNFQSYYLKVFSVAQNVPTNYNPIEVDLTWRHTPGSTSTVVYEDMAQWWSDGNGGTFSSVQGIVMLQDNMHGPYLEVLITNEAGTLGDTMNINYTLIASTRQLSGPFFRQENAVDGTLFDQLSQPINAGQTMKFTLPLSYGRIWTRCFNAASTMNFTFEAGNTGQIFQQANPAGPVEKREEFIIPKRALLLTILNGATNTTFSCRVQSLFDKS